MAKDELGNAYIISIWQAAREMFSARACKYDVKK